MSDKPLSHFAEVNPKTRLPAGLGGGDWVSFIPMGDVSETGRWTQQQMRPLREVASGFTSFEDGDVLVAKITPCLENGKGTHAVGLQGGVGFGSTEFHVLRAKPGHSSRFLFQVTQWRKFRLDAEARMEGSAGQQRMPRSFFDNFLLPEIAPKEQARIAEILDTFDTAIQKTEALIDNLKAIKQGLLHDLLTRGIDANGQLRPPPAEAPHLYARTKLGVVSKEWAVSSVKDEFEIAAGIAIDPGRAPKHSPRRYLRVANVQRERLDLEDIATLEATAAEVKARELKREDLLVVEGHASTAEIGRCAMANEAVEGMLFQNHLFRLRARRLLPRFGLLWLNSEFVRDYWRMEAATSSGLNTINRTKLGLLPVVVPSIKEQRMLVEREKAVADRIEGEARLLAKLIVEKAALMNDLLTGRVRVTPLLAEKSIERSA